MSGKLEAEKRLYEQFLFGGSVPGAKAVTREILHRKQVGGLFSKGHQET
jgi:hypothetical protein